MELIDCLFLYYLINPRLKKNTKEMDFGRCFQILLFGSPYFALILNEKSELIFNYFSKFQNHLKVKIKFN
jgi:hypothetical protein